MWDRISNSNIYYILNYLNQHLHEIGSDVILCIDVCMKLFIYDFQGPKTS